MYDKNLGSKGRRDTEEVELTVAHNELEAALTTGRPIGTTGGKIRRERRHVPGPLSYYCLI